MNPGTVPGSISIDDLKHALRNLYDPARLGKSPLVPWLGILSGEQAVVELRRRLVQAIQSLKPEGRIPQSSSAWRIYHVLTYRYVEQMSQKQVAADMGLVIRQLRRLETAALQSLLSALVTQAAGSAPQPGPKAGEAQPAQAQQELDWLMQSTPCETTEIVPFMESILQTAAPLLEKLGVEVRFIPQANLPSLCGQIAAMRQALMSILTALGQCIPGGRLSLRLEPGEAAVRLWVEATPAPGKCLEGKAQCSDALDLARRLLELSGSRMEEAAPGKSNAVQESLIISLALPAPGEYLVLALDDNLDALRLIERFLVGSRYRLYPLQDPTRLVETAESLRPSLIVLDVMLPGIDGWELLGRLRVHPSLGKTPLIVSTILPQESLALALGAASFLRKPVNQETFLRALDRAMAGMQSP